MLWRGLLCLLLARMRSCSPGGRPMQVIEVVVQNLPAGSNGGEYRFNTSRTGMEQHPFHLHGQHFWLLGTGRRPFWRCCGAATAAARPPGAQTGLCRTP